MARFDRVGIAERLRSLTGGSQRADLGDIAARLGVEEVSLRMSIDEDSPHPTIEVLAAAVREYGIDPTWLLTGQYDAGTHRVAMENAAAAVAQLKDAMVNRPWRISEPTEDNLRHYDDR